MTQIVKDLIVTQPPPKRRAVKAKTPATPPRIQGVLMRIVRGRGFGFIWVKGTNAEYFVHAKDMDTRESWKEGQQVTFIPGQAESGSNQAPHATEVRAVKKED